MNPPITTAESVAISKATIAPKPNRRRWFQFRLRTLLAITLVFGCLAGWVTWERQTSAKHCKDYFVIASLGAIFQYSPKDFGRPMWLNGVLGEDLTQYITSVELHSSLIDDDALKHIRSFSNLERLILNTPQITDKSVEHLKRLRSLKFLQIQSAQITFTGAARLSLALPQCKIEEWDGAIKHRDP